eukprot:TRINITY_DN2588_c0_g1_i4.p1 TRINITY_DN2588_c0_g1~~TRINITY_DN2588_c0_g1_i4.p1  ORF type:complete len:425 (+),score=126.31 TRINITY_DN2588_c0_g1_i4:90-1364(+)
MTRRPPRSTLSSSSAASDVYKRQVSTQSTGKFPRTAMSAPGSYVKNIDPIQERNRRIKESQIPWTPKYQQNRGALKDWESSGGREAQEVTYVERESDVQTAWRKEREAKIESMKQVDARSAKVSQREQAEEQITPPKCGTNSHAPERAEISPEIRKLDEELQAAQINGEWSEAQLEFERRKAAKKAGLKVDDLERKVTEIRAMQGETRSDREWTGDGQKKADLTVAQREWIEKKQKAEDALWNEGGTWLKKEVAATQDSAPSAILQSQKNPQPEEELGYDINIPKAYRNRARLTAPQSRQEEQEWAQVRSGRPRDQYYAKKDGAQTSRQPYQIPAARNTEADQQWQQGEQWLQQQINEAACPVDDEQPPAPPARESKEAPSEESSNLPIPYSTEPIPRGGDVTCLLYTSPSPRDRTRSRMPSSA